MKKAISTKTKTKDKMKRNKKRSKETSKEKRERKNKRKNKRKMRVRDSNEKKEKKKICPVIVEAIITKGGEYSLKYVKMCCEFAGVVSELIAVIGKSSLVLLIWGLFGSRSTPQLSLRGNGMYQKKQRSKNT